ELVTSKSVERVNLEFTIERRFCLLGLSSCAVLRTQGFVQARLSGSELDGCLVFSNGLEGPVGIGTRLSENLQNAPGFWISLEHLRVAVLGDEKMRLAGVIEDIDIVGSQLSGLIESGGRRFWLVGRHFDDAEPHPG